LNPNVSVRTERAIHWALQLHPEDRPTDIDGFIKALFVEDAPATKNFRGARTIPSLIQRVEVTLIVLTSSLMLISLLLTLLRNF